MAIYHLDIRPVKRADGYSAVAKAAYISRSSLYDKSKEKKHNYLKNKDHLLFSEICFLDDTLPDKNRASLWNAAERVEKRKDATLAREYRVALPKELSLVRQIRLSKEFALYLSSRYQVIVDLNIHDQSNNNGNYHAHLLTSTRKYDPINNTFTDKSNMEIDGKKRAELFKLGETDCKSGRDEVFKIRKEWEVLVNKYLQQAEISLSVSCAKKADRSTVKRHVGKNAQSLMNDGIMPATVIHNKTVDIIIEAKAMLNQKQKFGQIIKEAIQKVKDSIFMLKAHFNKLTTLTTTERIVEGLIDNAQDVDIEAFIFKNTEIKTISKRNFFYYN